MSVCVSNNFLIPLTLSLNLTGIVNQANKYLRELDVRRSNCDGDYMWRVNADLEALKNIF